MIEAFWDDSRIMRLTYLYDLGWTYSQIAIDMGATRSAVSGKVARLNLARPARSPLEVDERRRRLNERKAREQRLRRQANGRTMERPTVSAKVELPPIVVEVVEPTTEYMALNIPYAELRDIKHGEPNQCRYIADGGPDFLACGNETLPGASYCPRCHGITHFKAMNISEQDRNRRAAHFRKMGRNPQVIITSPPIVAEEAA